MFKLENLVDIEVENIDVKDYPDFVDAFISYAYDKMEGRELNDDELDYLNDYYYDFVQELAYERCF